MREARVTWQTAKPGVPRTNAGSRDPLQQAWDAWTCQIFDRSPGSRYRQAPIKLKHTQDVAHSQFWPPSTQRQPTTADCAAHGTPPISLTVSPVPTVLAVSPVPAVLTVSPVPVALTFTPVPVTLAILPIPLGPGLGFAVSPVPAALAVLPIPLALALDLVAVGPVLLPMSQRLGNAVPKTKINNPHLGLVGR
jgi:hypothetical protein